VTPIGKREVAQQGFQIVETFISSRHKTHPDNMACCTTAHLGGELSIDVSITTQLAWVLEICIKN